MALALNATTHRAHGTGYMAFGGMADFTLQIGISRESGIIAGGADVIPRTCVKVWSLWAGGNIKEAMELQEVLSKGDWVLTKTAIPDTKAAINIEYGYGGFLRKPLRWPNKEEAARIRDGIGKNMEVKQSLLDVRVASCKVSGNWNQRCISSQYRLAVHV